MHGSRYTCERCQATIWTHGDGPPYLYCAQAHKVPREFFELTSREFLEVIEELLSPPPLLAPPHAGLTINDNGHVGFKALESPTFIGMPVAIEHHGDSTLIVTDLTHDPEPRE